ncbi:MAG TPA: hypothetical protein VJW94_04640 [Candidatus Acidoferrum sp.]|nr:hypothetical protein [Candidatus Acidoferrum sp.]
MEAAGQGWHGGVNFRMQRVVVAFQLIKAFVGGWGCRADSIAEKAGSRKFAGFNCKALADLSRSDKFRGAVYLADPTIT